MRLCSVSEEMVPIDPVVLRPVSMKSEMVLRYGVGAGTPHPWGRPPHSQGALSVELLGGQIRVVGPPEATLVGLVESVRIGRALADRAARTQGRRAVALGSPVFAVLEDATSLHHGADSGKKPGDGFTCGSIMHIGVDSPEEGVQVLDRIHFWLPVLLALSANSPFWHGRLTRSESHRYYSRSKWPAPGPIDVFGSVEEYESRMRHLTHPAASRLAVMTDLDAQLSATRETLDVLLTDVCMDAAHAAVLTAITRALVEVMARHWRKGTPPAAASAVDLRASSSFAAVNGLRGKLISPTSARMRPAKLVVEELLALVRPVLLEYGEAEHVADVIDDMFSRGNGSRQQRQAYLVRQNLHDVVEAALLGTHDPNHTQGVPGAILAEQWALTSTETPASPAMRVG